MTEQRSASMPTDSVHEIATAIHAETLSIPHAETLSIPHAETLSIPHAPATSCCWSTG